MAKMKCSIIIPVLESYEAVRRQFLYMNRLEIPEDFEIILVDDGSRPPIMGQRNVVIPKPNFKFKYGYRADFRPFTKACALNAGAKMADGELLWIFAIDWMISKAMLNFLETYDNDFLVVPLIKYALLDEEGELKIIGEKLLFGSLGTSIIRKQQWEDLGGFNEKFIGFYPSGDDIEFGKRYYKKFGKDHFIYGPEIYGFPNDTKHEVCSWAMEDQRRKKYERPDIF